MNKMNNQNYVDMIDTRVQEVRTVLSNIDKGIGASGQPLTKLAKQSVQSATNKEKNILLLVKELIGACPDGIKLTTTSLETLTGLVEKKAKTSVVVKEGDNFLELIRKLEVEHPHMKEPAGRVMDYASSNGLKLDGMTFVKASK